MPRSERPKVRRRRAAVVALTCAVLSHPAGARTQTALSWITADQQAELISRLRQALPPGWMLTRGPLGTVPDQWRSLDTRTFQIDGTNGTHTFRIWFVPRDWIGIQPDRIPTREYYWEGVLMDRQYKALAPAGPFLPIEALDGVPVYVALHAMGMNVTSLVNGGWSSATTIFGDRLQEPDRSTQDLVRQVCGTRTCRDAAAYSLVILGVPARTLTLDCAEHGSGIPQAYCADELGYWRIPEAAPVLRSVVSNPATAARARRAAAFSIRQVADEGAGPALARALDFTRPGDRNTATAIADAIGRIRYVPAAPAILSRLKGERDRFTQVWYARVLTDLRFTAARPAIEELCETTNVTAAWLDVKQRNDSPSRLPEIALLRLTEPWGTPARGLRLRVLPPNDSSVRPALIVSLMENVGCVRLDVAMTRGTWTIDGQAEEIDMTPIDGNPSLEVRGVGLRFGNLSRVALSPGRHTISFALAGATSNVLSFDVQGP